MYIISIVLVRFFVVDENYIFYIVICLVISDYFCYVLYVFIVVFERVKSIILLDKGSFEKFWGGIFFLRSKGVICFHDWLVWGIGW